MMADGRVQQGCGLSFDALPPDVLSSSIWTDGGSEEFGRFGWDRQEFRGDNLCWFQTKETYRKFWMYKYRREHIRVIGNGHRVRNNDGNRNRTIGMQCEVEWNGDWGSGFGTGIGYGEHKTNEYPNHETCGEMESGMGIWMNRQNDKTGDNGSNRARPEDCRRLHIEFEAWPELRKWLGAQESRSFWRVIQVLWSGEMIYESFRNNESLVERGKVQGESCNGVTLHESQQRLINNSDSRRILIILSWSGGRLWLHLSPDIRSPFGN